MNIWRNKRSEMERNDNNKLQVPPVNKAENRYGLQMALNAGIPGLNQQALLLPQTTADKQSAIGAPAGPAGAPFVPSAMFKTGVPIPIQPQGAAQRIDPQASQQQQPQIFASPWPPTQQGLMSAINFQQQQNFQNQPLFFPTQGQPQQQPQQQQQQLAPAPPSIQFPAHQQLSAAVQPPAVVSTEIAPAPTSSGVKRKADDSTQSSKSKKAQGSQSVDNWADQGPPQPKDEAELARMTPAERRRYERNLREQQRSYRISQQIKTLRDVLTESNIPFKPNKFSILVCVSDYIKQLQARAIMLDSEHKKLLDTITKATEMVQSGNIPTASEDSMDAASSLTRSDDELVMVNGIDYNSVFANCPIAMGVASLDGRVLACNTALETLFGCDRNQMVESSLFLYIRNHQELFEAMADLLKRSSIASETGEGTVAEAHLLFWCGRIISQRSEELNFSITLTCTADSNPKYFNFTVTPKVGESSS